MKKFIISFALVFSLSATCFVSDIKKSFAKEGPPHKLEKISESTYIGVLRSSEKNSEYYVENGYKVPLRIASKGDISYLVNKKVQLSFDGEITKFKLKSLTGTGDSKIYYQGYIPPTERNSSTHNSPVDDKLPSSGGSLTLLISFGIALLCALFLQTGSFRRLKNPFATQ